MDIGASLAQLVANSGSLNSSLQLSNGFVIPDTVGVSLQDEDYITVTIGSLEFEAVEVVGISNKLSPLPANLSGNILIAYLNGNKQAPIALFTSMPYYETQPPTAIGYKGNIICDDLMYYNYGSGWIPLAPYFHKHFKGTGKQSQDSGGDFQQPVEVVVVEKTGWELGYD